VKLLTYKYIAVGDASCWPVNAAEADVAIHSLQAESVRDALDKLPSGLWDLYTADFYWLTRSKEPNP